MFIKCKFILLTKYISTYIYMCVYMCYKHVYFFFLKTKLFLIICWSEINDENCNCRFLSSLKFLFVFYFIWSDFISFLRVLHLGATLSEAELLCHHTSALPLSTASPSPRFHFPHSTHARSIVTVFVGNTMTSS